MNNKNKESLFDKLKKLIQKQPATEEEIKQLRLEYQKATLKAGIAKAKKQEREAKNNSFPLFDSGNTASRRK